MAQQEKIRIGEVLIAQKLISADQLQAAIKEQQKTGRKLGRIFVESGFVTEDQMSTALARQLGIPYIDLKLFSINPSVVRLLPEMLARRFRVLVLENRRDCLFIGMADPSDLFAYDEIARSVKRPIEVAVVGESELLQAIDRIYRRTGEITDFARELELHVGESAVDFDSLGTTAGLDEAPVVKLLQSIFNDATQIRASDIHIEPQQSMLQIRFRIDGLLHLQNETDIKIAPSLALRLKLMAGLDISEKRLPQDGRFVIKVRQSKIDVRMSTMPTQYGESVAMRLLNQGGGMLRLDAIGMPVGMLARFRDIISRPNGLILVTGPTGSGKTTTLYGALADLNTIERKLITVEDPVEYRLDGINQVQVNDKIELSFARVLRAALRQDPDVLLIGEIRDQETAQIALTAAMTGHLVLSTLHTNNAVSTPMRLMDMGVPRFMVASSLQAVLAQRLVRLICERCIEPIALKPNEHEWLRAELGEQVDAHQYFHGQGCSHCNKMGYYGRIGVYEMLEITQPVIDASHDLDPTRFKAVAREQMAGQTLRSHAVALTLAGKTTVAESMRVSNQLSD